MEFAKIRGRWYAVAGSEINGVQLIDVTKPRHPQITRTYDCAVSQGDPQVFKRGRSTYITYANDYEDNAQAAASDCYQEADARGFDAIGANGNANLGTLIIDITVPRRPRTVSFVRIDRGSHNMTVHPSGRFLYNSNSDLTGLGGLPAIEVYDITRLDRPKHTSTLSLTPLPGLGSDSHDITFNKDGTRGYSAALSHGVILDTTNPALPTIVSEFDDEAINVWHQMDPVTIGGRDFLIAEDEVAGAAAPGVCPTGGVHVFDVTDETLPVKVGYFNIADPAVRDADDTCTAHVFDIHEEEQIMTIAYYMGGVRVLDLSGLATAPIGVGQGGQAIGGAIKEIGHYVTPDANTWSAKTPFIMRNGDFFLFGDDINRGLDVYKFTASKTPSANPGTFVSAAAETAQTQTQTTLTALNVTLADRRAAKKEALKVYCLLKAVKRRR